MKNENIWKKAAQDFIWDKPYEKVLEISKNIGPKKWFVGGKLNYTKTIFEKNFALGNASKEAVIFYTSPLQRESFTYASLLDEVNALASYLEKKGVNKNSRVLILTDSKKEQVFSVLSLLRLGVQFGVLYSKSPAEIINNLITESKATHLLSNQKSTENIRIPNVSVIKMDTIPKQKKIIAVIPRLVSSNFHSFVCFSSGTTGETPKIFLQGRAEFFIGSDKALQSDFFYDLKNYFILNTLDFAFGAYPLMVSLITPLSQGGKVFFLDFKYHLNDKPIIKIIEKESIEVIASSPPFFEISQNNYRTDKIKKVILGGQKISETVFDLIENTFPEARLINAVGSQEASVYLANFSDRNSRTINILKPLPNLEYKIINQEFYIKDTWPCLALPLNNKQAYLKRWRGRFFKTGDLVKKTKLGLEIIGRTDKIIKHRGRKINLEYMEKVIESQFFVQKARCLIVQNKPKPEIIVFLSLQPNHKKYSQTKLATLIKKIIKDKFGSYAKFDKIIFVKEFPTSASGKIMEKILLKKYVK